jgi:uncharacterized membrane protein YoaK (UPF0700 family)
MPARLNRFLIGAQRSRAGNIQLGAFLSAIAGAINAGGFLAVQQYTSHMTGMVSSLADNLVLGRMHWVWAGLASILAFLFGAMLCTLMINFARKRRLCSTFAMPLALEAVLLLVFGLLGSRIDDFDEFVIPLTAALLCFMMGLQNALISKISNFEIRSTHVTGIVTDLGIELGRMVYVNRTSSDQAPPVQINKPKFRMLCLLLSSFFAGAVAGAFGFKTFGYMTTVPIALALLVTSVVSIWDDIVLLLKPYTTQGNHDD